MSDRAIELLRELRKEAESRRQHFGNINDMNFEPGIATDANRQVERIDAFLAAHDAALWGKCPKCWHEHYSGDAGPACPVCDCTHVFRSHDAAPEQDAVSAKAALLFLMGVLASAREYVLDAKATAKDAEHAAIYELWLTDAYPEALTVLMDGVDTQAGKA